MAGKSAGGGRGALIPGAMSSILPARVAEPLPEEPPLVAKSRQIVLIKLLAPEDGDEAQPSVLNSIPLGTRDQVIDALSAFNTTSDGSDSPESFGLLYGPGLIVQLPMVGPQDPVMQVAVSLQEEDIAWTVLARICRRLNWKMMDPASGRTFGV